MSFLSDIAEIIASSPVNEATIHLLRNVPGLPPIVQTIHILSIAAVMASVVFVALRTLGLAAPSQQPREMLRRLMPWTWGALAVLAATGLPFILARPFRYFSNPVFGWKMAFLASALVLSFCMLRMIKRQSAGTAAFTSSASLKFVAAAVLLLWVLTVLAGRWIAYAEYLFAPAY